VSANVEFNIDDDDQKKQFSDKKLEDGDIVAYFENSW